MSQNIQKTSDCNGFCFGVHRTTLRKWLQRYREGVLAGLRIQWVPGKARLGVQFCGHEFSDRTTNYGVFAMIELPSTSDRNFQAIRQRVINSARSIHAGVSHAPGGYVPPALVQARDSELVRVYSGDAVAWLLRELAAELER